MAKPATTRTGKKPSKGGKKPVRNPEGSPVPERATLQRKEQKGPKGLGLAFLLLLTLPGCPGVIVRTRSTLLGLLGPLLFSSRSPPFVKQKMRPLSPRGSDGDRIRSRASSGP